MMRRPSGGRMIFYCACVVAIGVLSACYFSMSGFYKTHFLPRTYLGSTDVSGWSYQDLKQYYLKVSDNRDLVLQAGDKSDTILLSDVDFQVRVSEDMKAVIAEQSPWIWLSCYLDKRQYDLSLDVSYDEEKLRSAIQNSNLVSGEDLTDSVDAKLVVGESGYEIVPEVIGTRPDVDQLMAHVNETLSDADALLRGPEIVVDVTKDYLQPKVFANDESLLAKLNDIQQMGGFSVTLDLVDAKEVLSAEQVNAFVVQLDDGTYDFDEKLVSDYVDSLAKKYTTLHSTREFKTSRGDVISFRSDIDSYGFIFDKPATCKVLLDALRAGKDTEVAAVWWDGYGLPKQRNSLQGDIGDTYVEVSIDEQHMWYYQDGELKLDTDVVTGTDVESRQTPTGVYFIWKRESPSQLSGSYGSQKVTYWMAFSWDGCGIHDALWRSSFGGDIWRQNGSHGCVNTPIDKCKQLYDMIEKDTPVVVYQRES